VIKIYGFDIVPGVRGGDTAYEPTLELAVAEAENHRRILQEDPELAYLLPLPSSDIYEIALRNATLEILVEALNDPASLAGLLELERKYVCRVGIEADAG